MKARANGFSPDRGVVGGLVLSALALATAPLVLPDSYSWVAHTTSEAAAQGLQGAWLSRFGFVVFGAAVIWLASRRGRRWGRWAQLCHGTFGVAMLAAATFSHRPFEQVAAYDATEDLLHSIAATAMGFAFALGVLAVAARRGGTLSIPRRPPDLLALVSSVAIPLGMTAWTGGAGLLQRAMFVVAYVWYGLEALVPDGRRVSAPCAAR